MNRSTANGKGALILQESVVQELSQEVRAKIARDQYKPPVPKTIAIPFSDYGWIKKFPLAHMMGQDNVEVKNALFVPEDTVRQWGLRTGDRVWFDPSKGPRSIFNVNGFTDSAAVQQRPSLISKLHSGYADRRIPIESVQLDEPRSESAPNGNVINRAISILSPLPDGGRVIIAAPPGAGKSTVLRAVYESLLRLMEKDRQLYVIALQVGERPEDATELQRILDRVPHDESRSELYLTPTGDPAEDPLEGHYWLTRFVKARAERLCEGTPNQGFRVVLLIDSISRVMMSHSFSDKIEKPKRGALSQGLNPKSLTDTGSLLNVAGNFGDRSLTIIATMLKQDDINPRRRTRSAEHVLFDQSGPSISSAIWGLVNTNNERLRPSVDLDLTFTREYHRISSRGQIEERSDVLQQMWNSPYTGSGAFKRGAESAVATLLKYAQDHPRYEDTQQYFEFDRDPSTT